MSRRTSPTVALASVATDPLPTIEALGRYARQLSDAHDALDVAGKDKEAARVLTFWREDAVKELALTLQPRTMADAVVTLYLVMNELGNLHGCKFSKHDEELRLAKVRRALVGLLSAVIKASSVIADELVDPFFLKQGAELFDPITEQLEKGLVDWAQG